MAKQHQSFISRQSMERPDFEIFHYRDPKMQEVPLHHHDFYELYYFLQGRVNYLVEGRSYELSPGELLLISPMELHRPMVEPGQAYERIVLWINAGFLQSLATEETAPEHCFGTGRNRFHAGQTELGALMERLVRESRSGRPAHDLYARGLFLQIMAELDRLVRRQRTARAAQESDALVARVLEHIGAHFREELSLDSLAALFYVDKYHLSHSFSRTVGTSLYRYVLLKRLQYARQLLSEGVSPREACQSCGFQDYANFYRAFKGVYSLSPQQAMGPPQA